MSLNDFIMANEVPIRLGFFFGVFAVLAAWEVPAPKRALTVSKAVRWANNLGLVFFNSLILRLVFPATGVEGSALSPLPQINRVIELSTDSGLEGK